MERRGEKEEEESEAWEGRRLMVAIEVSVLYVDNVQICEYMRVYST